MTVAVLAVALLATLTALCRGLVAKRWRDLSPWWLATFTRFVESGRRQLVLRVGRRGGKSSSLCMFAVAFALAYDVSKIPKGDVGVVAFISVSRDEANQRLRTIKEILTTLGVHFRPIDGGVELVGKPIVFKVFSATVAGVSGFTSILVVCDEVSKWKDSDTGINPAKEVLASVRPTMATQRDARIVLSSSPMGFVDAHAAAFDEGENEFQCVAYAQSWIANPTISEEDTHALERDERVWAREYAAVPQGGALGAIDPDELAACVRPLADGTTELEASEIVIDASGGKNDHFVIAAFQWVLEPCGESEIVWLPARDLRTGEIVAQEATPLIGPDGNYVPNEKWHPPVQRLYLAGMRSFEGEIARSMSTGDVADAIKRMARRAGASRVHGDQFAAWSWDSELARVGLRFESHAWSAPTKTDAVLRLRQLMRERILVINPDLGSEARKLVDEARTFTETILPSGAVSFGARGASHDDRIMTCLLAARVDTEGRLRGSPLRRAPIRIDREGGLYG